MLLNELFNADVDGAEFQKHNFYGNWNDYTYPFTIGGQKFIVRFSAVNRWPTTDDEQVGKDFDLQFKIDHPEHRLGGEYGNTGLSGSSAIQVFSKVIQLTLKFINEVQPSTLAFLGYKEENRDKLYAKMIQVIKSRVPNANVEELHGGDGHTAHIEFMITFS